MRMQFGARPLVLVFGVFLTGFTFVWLGLVINVVNRKTPIIVYKNILDSISPSVKVIRQKNIPVPLEVYKMKDQIAHLARKVYKAKKHARGVKTADSLNGAIDLLEEILNDLGINSKQLKEIPSVTAWSVCPEEYKGTTYGYPFFYEGFVVKDCEYAKPITGLVTITAYIKADTSEKVKHNVENFLTSVYRENSKYRTVIAADISTSIANKFTERFPNLELMTTIKDQSAGKIWNNLVNKVNTEYVLIARNVEKVTNDSRLDRLIREIESLTLSAAAGAIRTTDGHWSNGCHQVAYKNHSLSFYYGYDESMHECLFCDYVDGPFVATKQTLKQFRFKDLDETDGLFEDWFLSLYSQEHAVAVCPDSMFHTFYKPPEKEGWDSFLNSWGLYQVRTPLGRIITSSCDKTVKFTNTKVLSPCVLNTLADALKFLMTTCKKENIICELQEGTALGAVKFNKILPWERDADVTFLSGNYSAFQNLFETFSKANYVLKDLKGLWCCADNRTAGGKFLINLPGWHIELYGQHMMDSELFRAEGMNPTQVLLDGQWVNVPRNPGLFVRNRYGHEIYRHALHWMTLGEKTGWINYKTAKFLTCEQPGHHACIDRYNTDGNLQFKVLLP